VRRSLAAVVAVCVLAVPGCGVGSEDGPQLIEESTQQPPPATPSFDTEQSPAARSSAPTTVSGTASVPGPAPTR
jgi:hypothetical protein